MLDLGRHWKLMQTLGVAHWALAVQLAGVGKRHFKPSQIELAVAQSEFSSQVPEVPDLETHWLPMQT